MLGIEQARPGNRLGDIGAAIQKHAEGSYEVTLPVTAKVVALVKPEYRKFFIAGR
jgi:methionine aminopeptidase